MRALSASSSGTGASAILARRSSSGILLPSMSFPTSVRTIVLTPSTSLMSASFLRLSHPTATLPMPSGISASMSFMGMLSPWAWIVSMAILSGSPFFTTESSEST